MNRRNLVYHSMVLLLITCVPSLQASSLLMGRLMSVHPYGAQDTARNPALLSRQQQNNAIGLLGDYQTYASSKINLKQAPISMIKPYIDRFDAGTARVSYSRKIDIFALGLDLFSNYNESKQKIKSLSWDTFFYYAEGSSKNINVVNALTTSFSIAIDGNNSIGLKLNCIYNSTTTTEKIKSVQISPSPVFFHDYSKTTIEEISSSPEIGYLYKFDNSEIGLMFSPGTLSWKKETIEGLSYDLSPLLAQMTFKGKGKLPYSFSYTRGPGFTAGTYARPAHDLGIALEFDLFIPVTYREKFLVRAEKLMPPVSNFQYFNNTSLGVKSKVTPRPAFSIRGGFESFISSTVTLNLGAGFNYNIIQSETQSTLFDPLRRNYLHSSTLSVFGMAGIDLMINKYSTITFGSAISYYTVSHENTYTHTFLTLGRELHNSKSKLKIIVADAIIASSFGF